MVCVQAEARDPGGRKWLEETPDTGTGNGENRADPLR